MAHLSSYDNIFETETWYFWDNVKVLLEQVYKLWTSESVDITGRLTN